MSPACRHHPNSSRGAARHPSRVFGDRKACRGRGGPRLSPAGKPLLVRYDLKRIAAVVERDALRNRPTGMWRDGDLLPVADAEDVVSLGEPATPLVPLNTIAAPDRCAGGLLVNDESRLPTDSFKARGLAMGVDGPRTGHDAARPADERQRRPVASAKEPDFATYAHFR